MDDMLRNLGDNQEHKTSEMIKDPDFNHRQMLWDQVEKDGYIMNTTSFYWRITPKGVAFIKDGGYVADYKRQKERAYITKSSHRWTKTGVWLSASLTLVGIIYEVLRDILK